MTDTLPTLWKLEPHTAAKHRILRGYLDAWFPILARYPGVKRILYLDGFAGPGEYDDGEDGSPVIALKAVLEHSQQLPATVRLVFVESDPSRYKHLCSVLKRYDAQVRATNKSVEIVSPFQEHCETLIRRTISEYNRRGEPFGPALVFLDQFGYSDVPLDLIAAIMKHQSCEVFSYLHGDGIRRFLGDETKHTAISTAFGGDSWKKALVLPQHERVQFLAAEYRRVLKAKAGVQYVWTFSMHGEGNKLLYWLFFCTNHRRGLEEMKRAMARVDASGGNFSFSDATSPNQLTLFSQFSDAWLVGNLRSRFAGTEATVGEVARYVLEETPGVTYKKALQTMESAGAFVPLDPPPGWRRGSFPDENLKLRFAPK